MYHEVEIQKPSQNQLSKLRNGHPVRVKIGSGLKVHLSAEQHKKINRAHNKEAACTICLDPFQQHHMKGRGTRLEDQSFSGNDVAHFIGAHESSDPMMSKVVSLRQVKNEVKNVASRAKKILGLGVESPQVVRRVKIGGSIDKDFKKFFTKTVPSTLIHHGIPATAAFLGGVMTPQAFGVGSIPAAMAGKALAAEVGRKTGLGLRRGKGVLGPKIEQEIERLIGQDNMAAISKKVTPLIERGLNKAKSAAMKAGIPVEVSDMAENVVSSYARNPEKFQDSKNLAVNVEHAALTGEGVHKKVGGGVKGRALFHAGHK